MRSVARWFLLTILVFDLVFAGLFYLAPTVIGAEREAEPSTEEASADATAAGPLDPADPAATPDWTRRSLALLAERLQQRTSELDRRETELAELDRGAEVLRRAGVDAEPATAADAQPEPQELEPTPAELARKAAFARLQRAYENMEPDSAALALSELAKRDRRAVVELLMGWSPRVSGAILDSLTQTNPGLAADLSYVIWKNSGNAES